jgi:hypothetical protein
LAGIVFGIAFFGHFLQDYFYFLSCLFHLFLSKKKVEPKKLSPFDRSAQMGMPPHKGPVIKGILLLYNLLAGSKVVVSCCAVLRRLQDS